MPNRIIRDWTDSERIDTISFQAEVLLLRLMMKADDLGAYHANPKLINSFCFPLKNIRETDISRWLQELVSSGLIALYDADNKSFLHIINFGQRLRTVKPKYPQIPDNVLNKILSADGGHMSADCQSESETETETEDEVETETETPNPKGEYSKDFPGDQKKVYTDKSREKKEKEKSSAKKEKEDLEAIEILDFLNLTANKNFQPIDSNLKFIRARLQDQPAEILKQVIQLKTFDWKDDFKMNDYLRPETLFNPTKFQTYIQKVEEVKQNPQKFKSYVEQRNSEIRKSAAKHFDPLDSMSD